MNVHTNDTSLSLTYWTIGIYRFRLSVDSGSSEELWMMNRWSCIITWFLGMRLVRWEGNQSTTSITILITRDWGRCNQVSCLWWMPGCMEIQVWLWLENLHLRLVFISLIMIYKHYIQVKGHYKKIPLMKHFLFL